MKYIINKYREVILETSNEEEINLFISKYKDNEELIIEEHQSIINCDYEITYNVMNKQEFLKESEGKYISFSQKRIREIDEVDEDGEYLTEVYYQKFLIKVELYETYLCKYIYEDYVNRLQNKNILSLKNIIPKIGDCEIIKTSDDRGYIEKHNFYYNGEYEVILNLKF